jgi:hypothetical protein
LLSEIFVCGKLHKGIHLLNSYFSLCQRHLHELDGGTVGISNVDNALACVRTGFERLRFAGCSPTGCDNFFKDGVEIIYDERDMDRSDIARPNIDMLFSIGRREILEQFYFVSGRFHNRELELSAFYTGNLIRHLARLMCAMRKLKTENVLPEVERALEIRDCDARMVRGRDAKFAHALKGGTRSPLRGAKLYSALPILI